VATGYQLRSPATHTRSLARIGASNMGCMNDAVSEIFDPSAWTAVPGFDFTDITYHRANDVGVGIGGTTFAGHLCDISTGGILSSAGRMHPPIRFGADLMSRVSYVMMNPGGDRNLTEAVRTALNELITELSRSTTECADAARVRPTSSR